MIAHFATITRFAAVLTLGFAAAGPKPALAGQIAAGDVIYSDSTFFPNSRYGIWFRLRPTTGEVIQLDWEPAHLFLGNPTVDSDGHILLPSRSGPTVRINPATGRYSEHPFLSSDVDIGVTDDGDYIRASISGRIVRVSRDLSTRNWIDHWWDYNGGNGDLAIGAGKAVMLGFRNAREFDLETGSNRELFEIDYGTSITLGATAIASDGTVYVSERYSPTIHVVDEDSGALVEFLRPEEFLIQFDSAPALLADIYDLLVDDQDRLWVSTRVGLYQFDANGSGGRVASLPLAGISRFVVLPADWTPPVPEPASISVFLAVLAGLPFHRRRSAA